MNKNASILIGWLGRTIDLYPDFSCLVLLTPRVIETFSMMQLSIREWLWNYSYVKLDLTNPIYLSQEKCENIDNGICKRQGCL